MMPTRNLLICLIAVTLSLGGIALAKAVHQELVDADGNEIGKANLDYAKGADKTEIQVHCWDLEPETEYLVLLCECNDDGGVTESTELGTLTTQKNGKGHLHARVDGDVSDRCLVIGTVDPDGHVVPLYYPDELRLHPIIFPPGDDDWWWVF